MNRKGLKLRLSLLLLCIAALPALVACSLFFTEADMQLLDTAVAAEAERLKISVAPAEVLSQQLESGQSTANAVAAAKTAVCVWTSSSITPAISPKSYEGIQDSAKEHADLTQIDVDSGTTAGRLFYITKTSETERRIRFSFVGWLTTIYQEGGQYSVVTAFNQDTLTKTMVLEDGLWKTLRIDEHRKGICPDDYVYEKGPVRHSGGGFDFRAKHGLLRRRPSITVCNPNASPAAFLLQRRLVQLKIWQGKHPSSQSRGVTIRLSAMRNTCSEPR